MNIKCFSKRKLNVRISKTKIKCAILGFSQNCCILGKSRKKVVKFIKNSTKFWQKFNLKIIWKFATFCKKSAKHSAIFNEKIEIRERCKGFDSKTVQRSALYRSRRELSNEYLLDEIGVDIAENELLQVLSKSIQYYSIVSLVSTSPRSREAGQERNIL